MRSRRGASIAIVLTLVTVMSFLAAAMTALFMMNVNLTQSSFNGDIALTEAEAGVQELLYRLGEDDTHSFGRSNEEIRGRVTPGFQDHEAFHVLTFNPGAGWPYSVNNVGGSGPATGYASRVVPRDCVHVLSTGVCRGQRRTIEVVVRKPPAPFGLGTSGKIHAKNPVTCVGTSGSAADEDRPGHIVSNSAEGIVIEGGGGTPTLISGFAKSVGPITIAQPAQVKGGIRPHSSLTSLPELDIESLNPATTDMTGVVKITDTNYSDATLDIMYYSNHPVIYDGHVKLKNAFLYVDGDLTIKNGIEGKGAIVCNGAVTIQGGVDLAAADSMEIALLAKGKVTLKGGHNCFRGLIYSEQALDAQNISVIGYAIVNAADPAQGGVELDHVRFVTDTRSAGNYTVTSRSRSSFSSGQVTNEAKKAVGPSISWKDSGSTGSGPRVYGVSPDLETSGVEEGPEFAAKFRYIAFQGGGLPSNPDEMAAHLNNVSGLPFADPQPAEYAGPSTGAANAAYQALKLAAEELEEINEELERVRGELDSARAAVPPDPGRVSSLEAEEADLVSRQGSRRATITAQAAAYTLAVEAMVRAVEEFMASHVDQGGYSTREENVPFDVTRTWPIDLNKYFPASDRCQVTFWQVHRGSL